MTFCWDGGLRAEDMEEGMKHNMASRAYVATQPWFSQSSAFSMSGHPGHVEDREISPLLDRTKVISADYQWEICISGIVILLVVPQYLVKWRVGKVSLALPSIHAERLSTSRPNMVTANHASSILLLAVIQSGNISIIISAYSLYWETCCKAQPSMGP